MADRVEAVDPDEERLIALFDPRRDTWSEHFRWVGYVLVGQSGGGRATAIALNLNHPRRILIRQAERLFDLFPP